eukprot:10907341-Lingulodinium_polyedra.AAC.1
MQAAARAAFSEVVRAVSTAVILRAGVPSCPDCSPSLNCAEVRCPACSCSSGGRWAESPPSSEPGWTLLAVLAAVAVSAFAAGWLARGLARETPVGAGGVWLRQINA